MAVFCITMFYGCNESTTPTGGTGTTGTNNTLLLTTPNGGTLSYDGYTLSIEPFTVPKTATGGDGSVTFSIETNATLESGIAALPSGQTLVGKYVKFGPDGFTFSQPIKMTFSASGESSPENLVIMRYYPDRNQWFRVNTSAIDTVNKTISTNGDSLKLGYFALTKTSTKDAPDSQGGIEFEGSPGYWYTLTVKSCVLTYPGQGAYFSGGSPVGHTFSSGTNAPGTSPLSPTHAYLPQGTYEIWLTRTDRTTMETFSSPYTCTIGGPLVYWGWGNPSGWAHLTAPGSGSWVAGGPQNWPPATIPMGTGNFQATLTWVNTSSSSVDLDLYLTMPNNEKVYYSHPVSNDSCFKLDRDFRYTLGNATENIYSLKSSLPTGSYKVEVNYFGGTGTKPYNVRILINGTVTNYSGSLSSGTVIIRTFSL